MEHQSEQNQPHHTTFSELSHTKSAWKVSGTSSCGLSRDGRTFIFPTGNPLVFRWSAGNPTCLSKPTTESRSEGTVLPKMVELWWGILFGSWPLSGRNKGCRVNMLFLSRCGLFVWLPSRFISCPRFPASEVKSLKGKMDGSQLLNTH